MSPGSALWDIVFGTAWRPGKDEFPAAAKNLEAFFSSFAKQLDGTSDRESAPRDDA